MANVLQSRYGFKINHQTDILFDRKASRSGIYKSLRRLAILAGESVSVLIYYAGHGDAVSLTPRDRQRVFSE
jgi:hypothetical protein